MAKAGNQKAEMCCEVSGPLASHTTLSECTSQRSLPDSVLTYWNAGAATPNGAVRTVAAKMAAASAPMTRGAATAELFVMTADPADGTWYTRPESPGHLERPRQRLQARSPSSLRG
jgi:hypothetical protein